MTDNWVSCLNLECLVRKDAEGRGPSEVFSELRVYLVDLTGRRTERHRTSNTPDDPVPGRGAAVKFAHPKFD